MASQDVREEGEGAAASSGIGEETPLLEKDETGTTERALVAIPEPAPPNILMPQASTITNVDNRQYQLNQQTICNPMPCETFVGGSHNLNLKAEGHSVVNIYTGQTERKECHLPVKDDNSNTIDETRKHPQGTQAIAHVDYNELCFDIIERFEEDPRLFRKLKYICRADGETRYGIPKDTLNAVSNPEEFIECLETCKILGPHNLEFLYQLMKRLKQDDLANQIESHSTSHAEDRLQVQKPNGTTANGKFNTEIILHGEISQRTMRDVDRYKDILCDRLAIPKTVTNFIGAGDGSVVLVFQLPLQWPDEERGGNTYTDILESLLNDVRQRAEWLLDKDIIGIHIEGQDYVDLTGITQEVVLTGNEVSLLSDISDDEHDESKYVQDVPSTFDLMESSQGNFQETNKHETHSSGANTSSLYLKGRAEETTDDSAFEEDNKNQISISTDKVASSPTGAKAKETTGSSVYLREDSREDNQAASSKTSVSLAEPVTKKTGEELAYEKEQLRDIRRRIRLLESNEIRYIPSTFKTFVRKLQWDIRKAADTLAQSGKLELAVVLYSEAILVEDYARNVGYSSNNAQNRNIILSRVECALKMMMNCTDDDLRQLYYQQCTRDCELVHRMDRTDNRPHIFMIAALYGSTQCRKDEVKTEDLVLLYFLIEALPRKDRNHPLIKDFINSLENLDVIEEGAAKRNIKAIQGKQTGAKLVERTRRIGKKKGKRSKKRHRKTGQRDSGFDTGNTSTGDDIPKRYRSKPMFRLTTDSESGIGSEIYQQTTSDSDADDYSCSYCRENFSNDEELQHHITTPLHKTNLNSDQERPWKYRSPPLNVINGNYQPCERYFEGKCPFTNVDTVNNSCSMAHSKEELLEWKERHRYRKMKMQKASQKNLFSFVDVLQMEYYLADNQLEVMTEKVPEYVQIEHQPPNLRSSIRSSDIEDNQLYAFQWTFTVKTSKKPLNRIGLLHDEYRIHFHLSHPVNATKPQICPGDQASPSTFEGGKQYTIGVKFSTCMLGKFEQWIVFDFGERPAVFRKLAVHVGSDIDGDNILQTANTQQTWDSSNCKIVSFYKFRTQLEKNLEKRYRLSELKKEPGILNRENYQPFMHEMLKIEEMERTVQLKRFGMEVDITPKQTFHLNSRNEVMTFVSERKQLFGKIDLTHALHDDTNASQIVLTSVQYVLIKFDTSSEIVYEAKIFKDREMEDKQTKDELYVMLSAQCVRDRGLVSGQTIKDVQIQFQLDRYNFLIMHHAIERMTSIDYLFPPKNPNPALICPQERTPSGATGTASVEMKLNKWQEAAARFIISRGGSRDQTPLLLLYGPFGTGKTLTIATAVIDTVRKTKKSDIEGEPRILICTHSNSAADLYITNYFDAECKASKRRIKMRRVYATTRDVRSIPRKVRPYVNTEKGHLKIDLDDIRKCHLVITTTTTAARLHNLPKNHFTHILIDEAGQVLETEAIIPLTLAKHHTCVVLAGDHIQMGPVVYSQEARENKLHHSLLERLFEYSSSNNCLRHIILSDNYRSRKEILKFLSELFYHARHLQALGDQPVHPKYYPLEFRAVLGDDEVLGNSYVNNFEAEEIVKRVQELEKDWPTEHWGEFEQSEIGVLTPYTLQVRKIRKKLRIYGYSDVTVERVQNVQGKEYRVVFISTVRTRHSIQFCKDSAVDDNELYLGFLSDSRQLNTAFTRAKSLVVVVGNPVALCSVGECCMVWQKYVTECEDHKSLYGVKSVSDIKFAIQSLNPSPRQEESTGNLTFSQIRTDSTHKTLESANVEHQHMSSTSSHLTVKSELPDAWIHTSSGSEDNIQQSTKKAETIKPAIQMWKNRSDVSNSSTSETETEDEGIERHDLLRELRRESRKRVSKQETSDETDSEIDDLLTAEHLDFRMVEEDDHVRVEEVEGVLDDNNDEKQGQGTRKRCTFRVDFDGKRYAVPLDDPIGAEEILISTNTQRRTALDGDEVLVELIEDIDLLSMENEHDTDEEEKPLYGRVIKVERRALEMSDREIVCFPDLFTDNLMVPVDRSLPKIFILRPKEDRRNRKNDNTLTIPICRFRNGKAVRIRNVNVTSKERSHKLFVVRWVSWEERFYYPLGLVTEELPQNNNEETGLEILKRVYNVPEEFGDEDVMFSYDWVIPLEEMRRRVDRRAEHAIAIDPDHTLDVDDALSIFESPDGTFSVHIHIADVTYFVKKNHPGDMIDNEAYERATSHYPANNDPIHMLPPILSTGLCSFQTNVDRLAISLIIAMDQLGNIIGNVDPNLELSVIRCKAQLTYSDTEQVIEGSNSVPECTRDTILSLHHLATTLREKRLGSSRYALNIEGDSANTPQAHILVEEMMILANRLVAKYLVQKFPNNVPLRRQLPPEAKKFQDWYENHQQSISTSQYLTSEKEYMRKIVGENLAQEIAPGSTDGTIDIRKTLWADLKTTDLNDANNQRKIASMVISDQNHPQLVPAVSALHHTMRKADYVCSGDYPNKKLGHTGLHMDFYTHFTSPIRRYIDIVVHRIVKAVLLNEKPPYNTREVSDICHHCSVLCAKSKEFQVKILALQLALRVKQDPISVHSVVESVSEKNMMVGFSFYPLISAANRRSDVMFSLLKPIGRPEVDDEKKHARLRWKERIFDTLRTSQLSAEDISGNRSKQVELNTGRFIVKVSADRWMAIQESVNTGDMIALSRLIHEEETPEIVDIKESRKRKQDCPVVKEVTCELGLNEVDQKKHHYVEFKREFAPGDVLKVQLQAGLNRGLMSPKVALINVTPKLDFCAEHRHNAVQCFAEIVDKRPSREDINTYQTTWRPIIEMMTSYNSVYGNETVVIHGVQIEWQHPNENALPCGSFNLASSFCNARHIKLFSPKGTGLRYDYLCIRYRDSGDDMSFTYDTQQIQYGKSTSTSEYQESTFVAHAFVVDTNEEEESMSKSNQELLTVFFEVHHSSSPLPIQLLSSSGEAAYRCTVEIIPKPVPDRRLEKAILEVHKAPQIIQDICLLKQPKENEEAEKHSVSLENLEIQGSPFPPLNDSQKQALRSAIIKPFTVIQGPPGTGKTMTGACLVHFFTKMNSKLRNTGRGCPQVLYCGPSNKSVDVIADYLKRFQGPHQLSMVRVYSESIEYKDFPPPGEPGPRRKMDSEDVKMDPELKDIALHFRIRRKPNKRAELIRAFETQFGPNSRLPPNDSDFVEYKRNIEQAEREELQKHQVVLCTCNTSGQYRIRKYTNIVQCIVDEAGMCNEPETLIPLVKTKPQRIVLVGDHQQLRPIIQENTAQQLGMDISLLERYSKDMEMLDTQYRMHTAICEFPSNAFYNGKLKTAKTVTPLRGFFPLRHRWPGGEHQPTVFCHTIGREETLSVHTEEGNEMSKANMQEVYQVVRIARTLVNHYNIIPTKVVILTQYQLQRKKIELALKSKQQSDIDVRTVIKSQGSEWDFVIISTVRSLPRVEIEENSTHGWRKHHLGFIADDNQMNVALTRAKKGLTIVGNKYLLQTDKRWNELLEYYEGKNCIVPANDFLPPPRKK